MAFTPVSAGFGVNCGYKRGFRWKRGLTLRYPYESGPPESHGEQGGMITRNPLV